MPKRLTLPDSASLATPDAGGRLSAPSALRNAEAICAALERVAPTRGRALELASGTGEHAVRLAARLPGLVWQPTEIDPQRRASIDAWAAEAALPNLRPALALDACQPGWAASHAGQDLIFASNILHLVPDAQAETLIAEAARALAPGGMLAIYGPFLRDEGFASPGDAAFHASLIAQDPGIGYKPVAWVADRGKAAGLRLEAQISMPANNLTIIFRQPSVIAQRNH
ncbi:DUF938 domain-containing protein [Rhodovulum sulfidophilum]|uniref:DUF938 domain-containing protein n=1 Tax=Rhodovulum sulfidophilum TaxID=35806 RepID=UPI001389E9D0|nr:DUF938 domain-containing protein [Rhodovulum sulfidophilum]NDK35470.1 DUF938 domain-containing protein [Rhodovulum sulfidophilum]